jgi:DNA-binding NtrC family response regulator
MRTSGNVSRAAELLGVARPTLYDLMEKYGLSTDAPVAEAGVAAKAAPTN